MKHQSKDDQPAATLGEFVRQARQKRGVSTRQLSEALHMSGSYISRLEAGHFKQPSPEKLQRIADYLKIKFSNLCAHAGYSVPTLPDFAAYLRVKYDMSEGDARSLMKHFEHLRAEHGIAEKALLPFEQDVEDEEIRRMREEIDWPD